MFTYRCLQLPTSKFQQALIFHFEIYSFLVILKTISNIAFENWSLHFFADYRGSVIALLIFSVSSIFQSHVKNQHCGCSPVTARGICTRPASVLYLHHQCQAFMSGLGITSNSGFCEEHMKYHHNLNLLCWITTIFNRDEFNSTPQNPWVNSNLCKKTDIK